MTQSQLRYRLDDRLVHVAKGGAGGFSSVLKQHPEMRLALASSEVARTIWSQRKGA